MEKIEVISPVDGSLYYEVPIASQQKIQQAVDVAQQAFTSWRQTAISERAAICEKFVEALLANEQQVCEQITWQMGRPISQTPGELKGLAERARHMINIAEQSLQDSHIDANDECTRFIRREAMGIVFTIAPWNYPFLTAINSIIPAIMAGNVVLLKHSSQTPLCAERMTEAFAAAGLPAGVFQSLVISHQDTLKLLGSEQLAFTAFTGSVNAGRAIQQAAASTFAGVALELGGKDPAYVRADADLDYAINQLVDGVYFNSGQSCCGIERIYVHHDRFQDFVDGFVALTRQYRLGNPLEQETTLGPMVRANAAQWVRKQISEAVAQGAEALIDESTFAANQDGSAYLAPQVLINVTHRMSVMREESFGPVVGIMSVESDQHAVKLMNDSDFGLTASVWTEDRNAAQDLGKQVETGTWFMNRCDYLDPALVWTGRKHSGRGYALSELGYQQLTQAKSFHLFHGTK